MPSLKMPAICGKSVAGVVETELTTHSPCPFPWSASATDVGIRTGAALADLAQASVASVANAQAAPSAKRGFATPDTECR